MRAILFDLDRTLVDSSALREARDARRWSEVFARVDEVAAFGVNAHLLPARAKALGLAVGVVSSSPAPYVDQILKRFGIPADVVVSGSEGYPPKPDPAPLEAALRVLGVAPHEAAHVGDLATDHEAAALVGMTSIGAMWAHPGSTSPGAWLKYWPDLALPAPALVLQLDRWPRFGPLAEVVMAGLQPFKHRGSILHHPEGVSLGRYFPTADRRANQPLSRAIVDNKQARTGAAAFTGAIERFLEAPSIRQRLAGALVTNVPPAPEDDFDRFAPHRAVVAAAIGGKEAPDLLRQRSDVPDYKHLRGRGSRDVVNRDRFEPTTVLHGDVVVLLDDVITTGSQLASCRTKLLAAGAGEVYPLTVAYAQEGLPDRCPLCDKGVLRLHSGRRGRFWGCSHWRLTGCPYTRDA